MQEGRRQGSFPRNYLHGALGSIWPLTGWQDGGPALGQWLPIQEEGSNQKKVRVRVQGTQEKFRCVAREDLLRQDGGGLRESFCPKSSGPRGLASGPRGRLDVNPAPSQPDTAPSSGSGPQRLSWWSLQTSAKCPISNIKDISILFKCLSSSTVSSVWCIPFLFLSYWDFSQSKGLSDYHMNFSFTRNELALRRVSDSFGFFWKNCRSHFVGVQLSTCTEDLVSAVERFTSSFMS